MVENHAPIITVPRSITRLDLGCGGSKKQDGGPWTGVDCVSFPGVDVVHDLTRTPWPWADDSVDEVHCSHFLEHLTNLEGRWERVRFFNELHRVMRNGAKATIIVPHWCSNRFYGDPTHKEPLSEMTWWYLWRDWRLGFDRTCVTCKGSGQTTPSPVGGAKCQGCLGSGHNVGIPNAPHADVKFNPDGYSCDFDFVSGYTVNPTWQLRHQEAQQFALQNYKEAALDMMTTLTCRKDRP